MANTYAPGSTLSVQDVADLIDHALLKPELTPAEVEQSCDRVLILNRGRVVAEGRPEEITKSMADPGSTSSPRPGFWEITRPLGTSSLAAWVMLPGSSPSSLRVDRAWARVIPWRLGTDTCSGALSRSRGTNARRLVATL